MNVFLILNSTFIHIWVRDDCRKSGQQIPYFFLITHIKLPRCRVAVWRQPLKKTSKNLRIEEKHFHHQWQVVLHIIFYVINQLNERCSLFNHTINWPFVFNFYKKLSITSEGKWTEISRLMKCHSQIQWTWRNVKLQMVTGQVGFLIFFDAMRFGVA